MFQTPILSDVILPVEAKAVMALLIGNILIGLIESFIVYKFFAVRRIRLPVLVIIANYISSIAGAFAIGGIADLLANLFGIRAFYHVALIGVILIAIYWVLSVIIEWPLFHLSFAKPQRTWRRTLAATAIAQTVSYALIVALYLDMGNNTLLQWHLVHNADFVADKTLKIVYAATDGSVKEMTVNSGRQQTLLPAGRVIQYTSIDTIRVHGHQKAVRISFLSASDPQIDVPVGTIIETGPASRPVNEANYQLIQHNDLTNGSSDWQYVTRYDYTPGVGLILERKDHSDRAQIAVDFFGLSWWTENAALLPNDQLILQLGPQIVLADLNTRQITALALGQSPVVILGSEWFVPIGSANTQPTTAR